MSSLYRRYTATLLVLLAFLPPCAMAASPAGGEPAPATSAIFDSPRLMSHSLAAEIAVHNGDLEAAFEHYLQIIDEADDVSIARRATHIGLHLKSDAVLQTASLWTRLAPGDVEAWKALLLLRINAGDRSGAQQAMQSLMETAAAMHSDGFIQVAAIVAESSNQQLGLELTSNLAASHAEDARAHYSLALA